MQLCFENTAPRVYLKPIDIQHIDGEGVTISLLSSKSIVHTAYFNWEKSEPDGGGWRGGNSEKEVIRGGEKNKGRLRPTEVIIESDSLYPMPFIVSYIFVGLSFQISPYFSLYCFYIIIIIIIKITMTMCFLWRFCRLGSFACVRVKVDICVA